jgi:hypothetical protein
LSNEKKKLKKIQIPDGLISNQHRKDKLKISPKVTYLYVWLKMLLRDYENNVIEITPKNLKDKLGWSTNPMIKKHLQELKRLGYITYQEEYDLGSLKPHQPLIIHIKKIRDLGENFKEITEKSIKGKILTATDKPEKAIRFCYLIKCYTNMNYGYCWLTYEQIEKYGCIRRREQNDLGEQLVKNKIVDITRGKMIKDNNEVFRKENNKYNLVVR